MILERIVADNRQALELRKRTVPIGELEKMAALKPAPLDFGAALRGERIRLIAEVKKASPSRGIIRPDFDPAAIARIYADNGASAISVLTEERYFRGSLDNLTKIRAALKGKKIPLLRKDFITDPYQVYESRAFGADAILLIAAILEKAKLQDLLGLSHSLGMACLVETHNEAEVKIALKTGTDIIGINNRDLTTFNVDISTTSRLRQMIPQEKILVSESGIKNRNDIDMLQKLGVDAVLIGEAFMSAPDIAARMKELL